MVFDATHSSGRCWLEGKADSAGFQFSKDQDPHEDYYPVRTLDWAWQASTALIC
jgi:hypothetical protein